MNNPIQELKTEHRAIERALTLLESIAEEIEKGTAQEDARRMLDFLKTFADTCHHGKEERVLFPGLEKAGVSKEGGPIGVMLREHDQGRGHIRSMAGALSGLAAGNPNARELFRQHAGAYAALLRQHIAKEDQVLFEIAERQLSQASKEDIQTEFDRIERDIVGEGRHEDFHRMLDRLDQKYRNG
jgi:hemerythrin-like domain-containing protein